MINAKTSGTPHFLFDVARGKVNNEEAVNIFGFNRAVGTSFETLWNDSAGYTYPSSASILDLVSTSASDTMSVFIDGLDADYKRINEVVTLTGTTAVTTTKSFLRVNTAAILAGSNVGDITISNGVSYAYIEAGIGLTQQCVYTVPAGHTLYIFRIDFSSRLTDKCHSRSQKRPTSSLRLSHRAVRTRYQFSLRRCWSGMNKLP
jgi:hypothetical protein